MQPNPDISRALEAFFRKKMEELFTVLIDEAHNTIPNTKHDKGQRDLTNTLYHMIKIWADTGLITQGYTAVLAEMPYIGSQRFARTSPHCSICGKMPPCEHLNIESGKIYLKAAIPVRTVRFNRNKDSFDDT